MKLPKYVMSRARVFFNFWCRNFLKDIGIQQEFPLEFVELKQMTSANPAANELSRCIKGISQLQAIFIF